MHYMLRLYFGTVLKHIIILFGLLAVVTFESRNMPTVDWIRDKVVIILNRIICALYKVYMHYTYVSKSCVEQCLEALMFMHVTRLAFTISICL